LKARFSVTPLAVLALADVPDNCVVLCGFAL